MQRARKHQSLSLKLIKGADRPDRTNYKEPQVDSLPVMPKFVKKMPLAAEIWDEYMSMGLGERVLTAWDSRAFGLYCVMSAEFEASVMNAKRGDVLTPHAAWLAQYRMYAELFGLVPAGRTRIHEKANTKTGTGPKEVVKPGQKAEEKRTEPGDFFA